MFKPHKIKLLDTSRVSETLIHLGKKPSNGKTTISELLEDFHENGIALAMIFFALPVAIPLPYPPGFTTVLGTPLIILALQMLLGYKKVRLPERINNYEINNSTLVMISNKVVPTLKKLEGFMKPRMSFAKSVYCEQFIGFISFTCAVSVAIPLPFTNAVPALAIALMSIGLINRDGIIIILGGLVSVVGLIIAIGAVVVSWVGIKYFFNLIF